MVTAEAIAEVVIELLAEAEGRPVADVMAEVAEGSLEMCIDSLRIVEIITRVEARFGVRLAADPATARATRSMISFARVVVEAIEKEGVGNEP